MKKLLLISLLFFNFSLFAQNYSLHFNGVDDYVEIPHISNYDVSKFTIEAWFKWEGGKDGPPFIISKGDGTLEIHVHNTSPTYENSIRFLPTPGEGIDANNNSFATDEWVHIACVYDPTQMIGKIYLNGTEAIYQAQTGFTGSISNNASVLSIGRRTGNTNPLLFFNGNIDEVRIWNKVLSQSEIESNKNQILSGNEDGLIAYYDFNEGIGNTVIDKSSNQNDGTIHGAVYSSDLPPNNQPITVTDIDGNIYNTTKIGNQTWTTSNLKVTKYNDGTSIPNLTNNGDWINSVNGAYCAYNNDQNNVATYGYLYNWYAVNTNKLAPEGWHVATDVELTALETFLGDSPGSKLKSITGWNSNGNGTDDFGFSSLPGGVRVDGNFYNIGFYGYWWSSTESDVNNALRRAIDFNLSGIVSDVNQKNVGLSVRLIKNETPTTTWQMQIKASVNGVYDNENYAGISTSATNNFDSNLDSPEPPTNPGNYVSVYFPHAEWENILGDHFTSDIRDSSNLGNQFKRWFFDVQSNVTSDSVLLVFTLDRIPSAFGKYVTDLATGKRINLAIQTSYTFYNSNSSVHHFMLSIGDSIKPAISLQTPTAKTIWQSGTSHSIDFTSNDANGIDSVQIFASSNNGNSFQKIGKVVGQSNSFNWTAIQEYLNNNYKIKVTATDSAGHTNDYITPFTFTLVSDSLATSFQVGWSLVSLPMIPADSLKTKILADDFQNASYFVWGYQPQEGYTNPTYLKSGSGYWLGTLNSGYWDVIGMPISSDSTVQLLTSGYNLVGMNYVKPILKSNLEFIKDGITYSYAAAVNAGLVGNVVYGYSGNGYVAVDTLKLFSGYWIPVIENGLSLVQKIPVHGTQMSLNKSSISISDGWEIPISIENSLLKDQIMKIGVTSEATNNYDSKYDLPRPPRIPGNKYLEGYIEQVNPNYPSSLGTKYATEFTNTEMNEWQFSIESSDNLPTKIKWSVDGLSESINTLTIEDLSNPDSQVDMLNSTEYSFDFSGKRDFKVSYKSNKSLSVEMSDFSYTYLNVNLNLNWTTRTETSNFGWEIESKNNKSDAWKKIGFVSGSGTTVSKHDYKFPINEKSLKYFRLKQIDTDGKTSYSKILTFNDSKISEFSLNQNYPNPFNPSTVISFTLPKQTKVELKIFDLLGRELKTLINNEIRSEGYNKIEFSGSELSNGVYLYQLKADNFVETKKMILVK